MVGFSSQLQSINQSIIYLFEHRRHHET